MGWFSSEQEQAWDVIIDALRGNLTLLELHVGESMMDGLSIKQKRQLVETLSTNGNGVLGVITSNIELFFSDIEDLQHDMMDESELRALLDDSAGERGSPEALSRRLSVVASEMNLPLPVLPSPSSGALSHVHVVAQAEALLEQRRSRQAAARESDLIENAFAAFLARRRLRSQAVCGFRAMTAVQAAVQAQLLTVPPTERSLGIERAFGVV